MSENTKVICKQSDDFTTQMEDQTSYCQEKVKHNHSLFLQTIKIEQNSGNLGDEEEFYEQNTLNFYLNSSVDKSIVENKNANHSNQLNNETLRINFQAPPNSVDRIYHPLIKQRAFKKNDENQFSIVKQLIVRYKELNQNQNKTGEEDILEDSRVDCLENTPHAAYQYQRPSLQSENLFTSTPQYISKITTPINQQVNYRKHRNALQNDSIRIKLQERDNEVFNMRRQRLFGLGKSHVVRNAAQLFDGIKKRKIKINKIIMDFFKKLENLSSLRRSNNLKEIDYEIINDKSCFSKYYKHEKDKLSQQKAKRNGRWQIRVLVFMPSDQFVIWWGMFSHIFFNLFIFLYSILIFFAPSEISNRNIIWYFQFAALLSIIDILVKLNTAFFNKDIIVKKRKAIILKYIKQNCIFDSISLLVIIQKIYQYSNNSFIGQEILLFDILGLLKLLSLNSKSFRQVIIFRESTIHFLKLIDLILNVIFAAHVLSICWYNLHKIQISYGIEMTWMKKYGIENISGLNCYIYSLYWAITTMTTVGYGDITPSNTQEALFTIIIMIMMSCVFAYSINNVGMILQEIQKSSTELNSEINTISKFLDKRHVNIELISRVRNFLAFLSEEQKERNKEAEDQILNKLSNKLREEIKIEINEKLVNKTPLFTQNFSVKTVYRLLQKMEEITVAPNEVVFNEYQIDDSSIYFIQSGQIQIYHSTNSTLQVVKTLGNMSVFGEISFFTGLARQASARSVGLSTLFKVSRVEFVEVLSESQEDFETFKMIQEKIIFQNDYSQLYLECFQCGNNNHVTKNCFITHHSCNKAIISLKKNFSIPQRRQNSHRRKRNLDYHTLLSIRENYDIQLQLKQLHENDDSNMFRLFNNSDIQSDGYDTNSSCEEFNTIEEYLPNSELQVKNAYQFSKLSKNTDGSKQDQSYNPQEKNQSDKATCSPTITTNSNNFEYKNIYFPKQKVQYISEVSNLNEKSIEIKQSCESKAKDEGKEQNEIQSDNCQKYNNSGNLLTDILQGNVQKENQSGNAQTSSLRDCQEKLEQLLPENGQNEQNIQMEKVTNKNHKEYQINCKSESQIQNQFSSNQYQQRKYVSLNSQLLRMNSSKADNNMKTDQQSQQFKQPQRGIQHPSYPLLIKKISKEEINNQEDPQINQENKKSIFNNNNMKSRKSVVVKEGENNGQNVQVALADLFIKSIQKELIQDKQRQIDLDLNNFDVRKNFKKFFVHNNFEWVLRSYNRIRRKKRERNTKVTKRLTEIRTQNRINEIAYTKKKIHIENSEIAPISSLSYGTVTKKSTFRQPIRFTDKISY